MATVPVDELLQIQIQELHENILEDRTRISHYIFRINELTTKYLQNEERLKVLQTALNQIKSIT